MPELLSSGKLADGRSVNIYRIITPDYEVTDRIKRYFMGSFSYELYRQYSYVQTFWRLYYREGLDGHLADYIEDHHYLAEVDGQFAARIWFAFNKTTHRGNFGNVYTEPEFRRLGLMNMLLKPCVADFHASPAKMLCCASGNKYAVAAYVKNGFKVFYGGETGPLCLGKVDFFEEEARAYPGHEPLTVRPGTPGDQFDCDKFLFFTRAMYRFPRNPRIGPAGRFNDYLTSFQATLDGDGIVNVAQTPSGEIAGYCLAVNTFGEQAMDFCVHIAYMDEAQELLRKTSAQFQEKYGAAPYLYLSELDTEKLALVRAAGFRQVANIPGHSVIFQ